MERGKNRGDKRGFDCIRTCRRGDNGIYQEKSKGGKMIEEKEDLEEKYKREIAKVNETNQSIEEQYINFHTDIEKFTEYLTRLEGELPHLTETELRKKEFELFNIVKQLYKNFDVLHGDINRLFQIINIIGLRTDIILMEMGEHGGKIKSFEKMMENVKNINNILKDKIDKKRRENKKYRAPDVA